MGNSPCCYLLSGQCIFVESPRGSSEGLREMGDKHSLEVDYTQGKIDGRKERSSSCFDSLFNSKYKPPSDPSRKEMYNRGFKEGREGR